MKKIACLLIAFLIFLCPLAASADAPLEDTVTFSVMSSSGLPIAGAAISGARGSDDLQFYGTTDNSGKLSSSLPLGKYTFTAKLNGSSQTLEAVEVSYNNDIIQFNTVEAKVKIQNNSKQPLQGVSVSYKAEENEYGLGISDYAGEISSQLFIGTYDMTASYGDKHSETVPVDISGTGIDHTFILDGTHQNEEYLTVKLLSSEGKGLEDGVVSYYYKGWVRDVAITDSGGSAEISYPKGERPTAIGIEYRGGWQQKKVGKDQTEVVYTTINVEFKLLSSKNKALIGNATYYAKGWKTFGTGYTTESKRKPLAYELLPGKYTFGIEYKGGYIQKAQDITADQNVVFRTVLVRFSLLSSKGKKLKGEAKYYAKGWKVFGKGKTTTKMEMLPTRYTFGITYKGGYMQKAQNVADNPNVVFRTVNVTFKIYMDNGQLAKGEASYYAKGWKAFGKGITTKNNRRPLNMEMLPIPYTFAAKLGSQRQQKKQNVGTDPNIEFVFDTSDSAYKSQVLGNSDEQEATYLDALIGIVGEW